MSMQLYKNNITCYLENFIFEENKNLTLSPTGYKTTVGKVIVNGIEIPKFVNEFWTSKQRQSVSIHEISYRACFKAQLPHFFINLLTETGNVVYDPFSGRGTTIIEAALLNRRVISNDINPLSKILAYPRLSVPEIGKVYRRLDSIPTYKSLKADRDLSMFFHPATESELVSLQLYLENRKASGAEDEVDRWIRMVATNRLTGHSPGFFSVYTLPPNQAVSPGSQLKINKKRNQKPDYRDTKKLIIRKTNSLLRNLTPAMVDNLKKSYKSALFIENDARNTKPIESNSVDLIVTSPPFLDVVQYSRDNWLRCWFNVIDTEKIEKKITMSRTVGEWSRVIGKVLNELYRVTKPGGWVVFEVGEVKSGKINLEEHVVPLGQVAGFECTGILINQQEFTKTSNIWGIKNNRIGTNTNRIVLFHKNPYCGV